MPKRPMPVSRNSDRVLTGAPSALRRGGPIRRVPLRSDLPLDLPITAQEIQMVVDALGEEIAALFTGDE